MNRSHRLPTLALLLAAAFATAHAQQSAPAPDSDDAQPAAAVQDGGQPAAAATPRQSDGARRLSPEARSELREQVRIAAEEEGQGARPAADVQQDEGWEQ